MILIFKYVFVCVCWCLSEMHCMADEAGTEQDFAPPWEPRFGPSPGLGCTAQRAQTGGHRGVFSHSLHQSGRAVTSGELFLLPCRQTRAPGQMEVPKFLIYWPWHWALREKLVQIRFLIFPFSFCILGGIWGDLKALSLPWLSQRSTGSTSTHQGPSATTP